MDRLLHALVPVFKGKCCMLRGIKRAQHSLLYKGSEGPAAPSLLPQEHQTSRRIWSWEEAARGTPRYVGAVNFQEHPICLAVAILPPVQPFLHIARLL